MSVRHITPTLRIGQRTTITREIQLLSADHGSPPLDLTNAQSVTITLEHYEWGHTAVAGGTCTITNPSEGRVEYTFTQEDTSLHGRYLVQFEVTWSDGQTELVPPSSDEWVIDIGRRQPKYQPLDVPGITADEGVFGHMQADTVNIGSATIEEFANDPNIGSLSIDTLDVTSLEGGIVGTRGPLTRLDGPDLQVNANNELEWVDPNTGGFTAGSDHDHSVTGEGGDTLRPVNVGTSTNPVDSAHITSAEIGSASTDVSRTAEEPVANVKDYGAVGDGATVDTAAIQAAVDAVAPVDGTVFFPDSSGAYIAENVKIPATSHVAFVGNSKSTTVQAPVGAVEAPFVATSTVDGDPQPSVDFRHLTIDGANEGVHGIDLSPFHRIGDSLLKHLIIQNCNYGIEGSQDDRQSHRVINCAFDSNTVGYYVINNHPFFSGCTFRTCTTGIGGAPYHMPVVNCQFVYCDYGIQPLDGGTVERNRIEACRFTFNYNTDITVNSKNAILDCEFNAGMTSVQYAIRVRGQEVKISNPNFEFTPGYSYDTLIVADADAPTTPSRVQINGIEMQSMPAVAIGWIGATSPDLARWTINGGAIRCDAAKAIDFAGITAPHIVLSDVQFQLVGDIGTTSNYVDIPDTYFGGNVTGCSFVTGTTHTFQYALNFDASRSSVVAANRFRNCNYNLTLQGANAQIGLNSVT